MDSDSSYGQVIHLPDHSGAKPSGKAALLKRPALTDMHPTRPADPAATAFALSLLPRTGRPALWVQDHASRRENGYIYTAGLGGSFGDGRSILQVTVSHPRDVLWVMEEGASCGGLSAVIGEIHGAPAVLDFTATKRLAMRAETSGVPVYLIRSGDPGTLSAARERWRVGALPSRPHPHDARSPGTPQWDVELFRARGRPPGRWMAQYDPDASRTADRLCLLPRLFDGAVETDDQPVSDHARQ